MLNNTLVKVVFIFTLCVTLGSSLTDEKDDCAERVKLGECASNTEQMLKDCRKSCAEQNPMKIDTFNVEGEGNESFFDLSAKTYSGDVINFNRFEGYVTLVINMAKMCKKNAPDTEAYFSQFGALKKIWPYSLEVVIFPFDHPHIDYENDDCEGFEEGARKTGRNYYFMEAAEFNGPLDNIHPVYRYLKSKTRDEDLDLNAATYFMVNTDGTYMEIYQNASLGNLKHLLQRTFDKEL